ncbi:hypothetical protein AB6D70_19770 [Vibrio splendidus]
MEYSLFLSQVLGEYVKDILNEMFPKIDKQNYESELAKKLIGKDIKKPEFAYKLASLIDPDSKEYNSSISLNMNDESISSLIKAVKYVCN